MKETMQMALTFFLTVIGWIIFRAETMAQAVDYLTAMVSNKFFDASALFGVTCTFFGIVLLAIEWLQRDKQHALQFSDVKPFNYRLVRWGIYYIIIMVIACYAGTSQTFIYFQF